jgi:hypothetical protein
MVLSVIFLVISLAFIVFLLKPLEKNLTLADLKSKLSVYHNVDIEVHTATARSGLRKTYLVVLTSPDGKYKLQYDV